MIGKVLTALWKGARPGPGGSRVLQSWINRSGRSASRPFLGDTDCTGKTHRSRSPCAIPTCRIPEPTPAAFVELPGTVGSRRCMTPARDLPTRPKFTRISAPPPDTPCWPAARDVVRQQCHTSQDPGERWLAGRPRRLQSAGWRIVTHLAAHRHGEAGGKLEPSETSLLDLAGPMRPRRRHGIGPRSAFNCLGAGSRRSRC